MKLDDIPKKNIYQTPDRYFDQLPGVVMTRVRKKEVAFNPAAVFSFLRSPLLRGAMAGLALVLSFIVIFNFNSDQSNLSDSNEMLLSSISEKDAVEYLMSSDQLETQDLTILTLSGEDESYAFIQASREEILQAVEGEDLDDVYLY